MRYVIAKVNKELQFGGIFGGSNSKVDFISEEIFSTEEEAQEKIQSFRDKLNEKCDKAWNEMSDSQQNDADEQFDKGSVYEFERYLIIPVQSVQEISSLPKHRRELK